MMNLKLTRQQLTLRKLKLPKWNEEKQKQKLLKKVSEKSLFKFGIVYHKPGSPYHNDTVF
jgi:hypothetical protein